jgi:lipopolysaccharide export system permease protein
MNIINWFRREYFPIRLIDKYIFSEFIKTFLGTIVLLTGILLISQWMDNQKSFSATKQPTYHLGLYMLYSIPKMITVIAPPALMFSVCFIVGQFQANKELVSIMAAGVSFYRAVSTMFFFGGFLWIFVLFWGELVARPCNNLAAEELSLIMQGIGTKKDLVYQLHIRGKEGFYYVYWYDNENKKIKGGFNYIKINSENIPSLLISAQSAAYNVDAKNWTMEKIEEIEFDKDLNVKLFQKIETKIYNLPEDAEYFAKPVKSVEQMNFLELGDEIQVRKGKGMPFGELEVERQSILASPMMCLIVVVIGSIAGASTPKGGVVASLFITIIVILVYYIIFSILRSLGENGALLPAVAVWSTPGLFSCVCFYLYKRFNL